MVRVKTGVRLLYSVQSVRLMGVRRGSFVVWMYNLTGGIRLVLIEPHSHLAVHVDRSFHQTMSLDLEAQLVMDWLANPQSCHSMSAV